jgi:tetratricopeptide (TPR) repeat protein
VLRRIGQQRIHWFSNLSREISEKLRLRLTGEEKQRLTKRYTENAEAYQLYVKGRYFWNRRTTEAIERATDFFQQAIALDPSFALAYVGLADTYLVRGIHAGSRPEDIYPKARAAASKALEIDSTLAEAHSSLATVKDYYDWEWAGGEAEHKRAIELSPNYATARSCRWVTFAASMDELVINKGWQDSSR